jgi:hypothetical protein
VDPKDSATQRPHNGAAAQGAKVESISPASYSQRSMWAFALRYRTANLNEMIIPWRIRGALRTDCLEGALSDLMARHPTLRARLRYEHGQLYQVVMAPEPVRLPVTEVDGSTVEEKLQAAQARIHGSSRPVPNVIDGPTMIALLMRIADDDHVLCMCIHHAMCDGGSIGVMVRDLLAFYRARLDRVPADLPPLTEQYADVAHWEMETYASGGFADEIAYWKEHLAGLPPAIALPTVGTRKGNRDWRAASPRISEPPAFLNGLRETARQLRVSPFSVMMASLAVLLRQRTGSEDLLIGVPTLNRWSAAAMQFVGYATSLMPVRMRPAGPMAFEALCVHVHQTIRKMLAYGRVPMEILMKETDLTRSGNTVFPVWAQFLESGPESSIRSCGLDLIPLHAERHSLLAELDVDMLGTEQGWQCEFAYRTSLLEPRMVHSMMADYVATLRHVQQAPNVTVDELVARLS